MSRGLGLALLGLGLSHFLLDGLAGQAYRDFIPHPEVGGLSILARGPTVRMAPSTAVAFGLLGLAFAFGGAGRWRAWIGATAASLVLLVACTSFLGVVTGFGFYFWGGIFLGMALPTATAFGVLGGGLLAWEWEHTPERWGGWPAWVPMPAAALVLSCALVLGQSHQAELRLIQKAREVERAARGAAHLRDEWQRLSLQLEDLSRDLALRGPRDGGSPAEKIGRFLNHHPGARSLTWAPAAEADGGWAEQDHLTLFSSAREGRRLKLGLEAEVWAGYMLRPILPSGVTARIHPRRPVELPPAEGAGGTTFQSFDADGFSGVLELGPDPRAWVAGRSNALGGLITGLLLAFLVGGLVRSVQGGRERAARLGVEMKARLKAEQRQQEFLAVVSHELRTPLTAIQGALKLLRHLAAGTLGPKDMELVDMADRNSMKLLRLVNDLLDMEKLNRGRTTLVPKVIEVGALVQVALSNHEPTFRARGIRGLFDGPGGEAWIQGDPDRLEQVVANLLSNATKFSRSGGEVVATVRVAADEARLEIRDQGPGIPEAFRDQIFQPFTQAEGANVRREGGTGLGLAISKALVEAMGGRIGFDSEEGKGTTFWLTFPAMAPPTQGVPEGGPSSRPASPWVSP
ncbi:MAG: HAMP domain-containing histidine kinase [Acidobacteria bacterium]|nr:HAMP domain-containing histidine kinase [Acidobacteriota bacterium]